jgi:hypothetical protein
MENFFGLHIASANSKSDVLTQEQQQLLREQVIDENQPGTIVRDFQTLLEFLQPKGVEVSSVNNFLPLKALNELNSRLSHPVDIQLKRPGQKAFPHINGLYLLLRCSGICHLKYFGKKQRLVLDDEAYKSWLTLNYTERYFNLLETWFLWADDEVIGERQNFLGNLQKILVFWRQIPSQGFKLTKYQDQEAFNFYPGYHYIALLHLFGFLSLKLGKPQQGKGWRIASLERLPFGDAMVNLLTTISVQEELEEEEKYIEEDEDEEIQEIWDEKDEEDELELSDEDEEELEEDWETEYYNITFGKFQPHFQHLFPEWEKNLVIPEQEFKDGIYVFKVSLSRVWRRIAIPAKKRLSWLAGAILDAFNFDFDHLYEFSYKDRFGFLVKIGHPYMNTPPLADEVRIGDLCLEPGTRMTYLYDFGDNWKFDVQLEAIDPPDSNMKQAEILESKGKAPPQYWNDEDEENWDNEEEEE